MVKDSIESTSRNSLRQLCDDNDEGAQPAENTNASSSQDPANQKIFGGTCNVSIMSHRTKK